MDGLRQPPSPPSPLADGGCSHQAALYYTGDRPVVKTLLQEGEGGAQRCVRNHDVLEQNVLLWCGDQLQAWL